MLQQQQVSSPFNNSPLSHNNSTAISTSNEEERDGIICVLLKIEKYLIGGWQSRILLALRSSLPNEVDWAFNKLVKLSFTQNFHIGILPGLQEILMALLSPMFDKFNLNTSPTNFETSSKSISLLEVSLFYDKGCAETLERVLQILHIIRNLSFLPENSVIFSRDHSLLTNLAKAIALPSVSYYIEIKQHAFDIFENMASLIHLRGPSDFYFACLRKSIFESDRALVLSSTRALTKLTLVEGNEKVIIQLDNAIISRLLQLILVPDEELVMAILEFFYNFSNLQNACSKMASCAPYNIVKLLLKYVHWKGEKPKAAPSLASSISANKLQTPRPRAQDPNDPLFSAALWLTLHHERDPSSVLNQTEFYNAFESYCRTNNKKIISVVELLKIVRAVFGDDAYLPGPPPIIRGFKPKTNVSVEQKEKKEPEPEQMNDPMDTDLSTSVFSCSWRSKTPSCSHSFSSRQELFNHIQEKHISKNFKTCEWKACSHHINIQQKHQTLGHVAIHLQESKFKAPAPKPEKPVIKLPSQIPATFGTSKTPASAPLSPFVNSAFTPQTPHTPQIPQLKSPFVQQSPMGTNVGPNSSNIMQGKFLQKPTPQQLHQMQMNQMLLQKGGPVNPQNVTPRGNMPQQHPSQISATPIQSGHQEQIDELRGIPLTALLVLRNLSRGHENRMLFYPYEAQFASLVANPRYSKLVASILSELVY